MDGVRILLMADSHLGFDLPVRPTRVRRRRRGHDFLANHAAALAPALAGEVDLVVHGGDVFHRPNVPPSLAHQAYEPLLRVAERGVPVFVVPGNHERARLPHRRFASHPLLHVFDRPRTFVHEVRGTRVALAGFPFERGDVRSRFRGLLEETGWGCEHAEVRVLCMHQCAEGARVGPADFTFRTAKDVVRVRDVPGAFAAVLSGHIHRHQVLSRDLAGAPLEAPVLYPGSIERTSTAECEETKGYMVVHVGRGPLRWSFRPLPARPMLVRRVAAHAVGNGGLESALRELVASAPADAVLTIRVEGEADALASVPAERLRSLAPPTMNVEVRWGRRMATP